MIKRPLIWILGAYLAGMYLAWQKISVIILVFLSLFYFLMIYLLMFGVTKKIINTQDKFLWSLPLLFFLGFYAMNIQLERPALYSAFEQEISCELTGSITMIVEKQWGSALYVENNEISLSEGNPYQCENIIVFCSEDQETSDYLVGNRISVRGTLQKFSKPSNPGQFNEELYYRIENIDFKLKAEQITVIDSGYSGYHFILGKIKNKLLNVYETILSEKESGALIAMLLGEKYLLDDEIKQLYQENGISHVLAISGLHISLIGMFIFKLLKKLKLPIIAATFGSIFFIYSYGVLTNFSVSTNRAVVMMVVMLLAGLIGKTYDMLSSCALSALIILLQNPLQIFSAGFLLSYGAVLGIAIVFPCLKMLFPTKNSFINSLFISLSAQSLTTPLVIYFYYQYSVYSIITNLIILPFVTILMLTSIFAGIAGMIFLPMGVFLIGGANYILQFYEWTCRIMGRLPDNLITVGRPDAWRLIVYFAVIAIFIWTVRKYGKKYLVTLLVLPVILLISPHRNSGLTVTMLDVGQGEAIYMESKSGTTYLVDGGSSDVKKVGTYRIEPFLLSQGTGSIDYVMISHADTDHTSGLKELMEGGRIRIKYLVLPEIENKDEAYVELETLALKQGIKLQYIRAGDVILDGKLKIFCLHPAADYIPPSSNAYSTVLSVSYGAFDMLLTGDLELDGEEQVQEWIRRRELYNSIDAAEGGIALPNAVEGSISLPNDYDILQVAHHGSRNSTSEEFLRLIRPEYALISCGKDNKYGHPHQELLDRLILAESQVEITFETGAITIKTDGEKLELERYLKQ